MKKTILALTAAGLLPIAGLAATDEAPKTTPAPTRFEAKTTYGDVARVLSSQPVYERTPSARRECRMENTGYNSAATEIADCNEPGGSAERIVAYDVTYQYMGRDFRIRLPYQPGDQIAVNVEVRPPVGDRPRGNRPSQYRGPY